MRSNFKRLKNSSKFLNRNQRGSASESLVTLSLTVLIILIVIQLALIYRVKLTLQYAAHEAARIGALNNGAAVVIPLDLTKFLGLNYKNQGATTDIRTANPALQIATSVFAAANRSSVWDGLVAGMLPLYAGSNATSDKLPAYYGYAYGDLIRSSCIEYLNPTQQSFLDWGFMEFAGEDRFIYQIPTDTLRYRKPTAYDAAQLTINRIGDPGKTVPDKLLKGNASNKTLAEANVLHLRINYGYKLEIPLAKDLFLTGYREAVALFGTLNDFEKAMLDEGKLPLNADGAVGMQTPLHWHPFYAFGPDFPMTIDPGAEVFDITGGNDSANFSIVTSYMKILTAFITNGLNNALAAGANEILKQTKKSGNGVPFCPATWLPEKWR